MKVFLLITLAAFLPAIINGAVIVKRQVSTELPPDRESKSDSEQEVEEDDEDLARVRGIIAAEYFPEAMSRERTLKMLKRAIELIEKPSKSSQSKLCRLDPDINTDAKNTLRFLTGDPSIGSTTDESGPPSQTDRDEDYCPDVLIVGERRHRVTHAAARNILKLKNEGLSEKSIAAQYIWYRRSDLPRIRNFVLTGGPYREQFDQIERYVNEKIDKSLAAKLPIHDYHIREWGHERADQLGLADRFMASSSWLTGIKERAKIASRKVTGHLSRSDADKADTIEDSKLAFAENYAQVSHLFSPYRIINVDQSGFNYEISNLKSLARVGTRDHTLSIDSANKNTHSYTIQPMLGRDGTLRGKLLICFREPRDRFGTNVERRVRTLEKELGNLFVVASKSGKMTTSLTKVWKDNVLAAELVRLNVSDERTLVEPSTQDTEIAGPSWASNPIETLTEEQRRILNVRHAAESSNRRPDILLLVDSWGGHSSDRIAAELYADNVLELRIPARTTASLQPLDVQVFRQYKILVKRIQEAASYQGLTRNITDRYGIMRMHSLVWNQLQAPVYRDMLLWAWRHTDPGFSSSELQDEPPPKMVLNVQFSFNRSHTCDVVGCNERAFITCAHCGKFLCLKHFLGRECFHEHGSNSSVLSSASQSLSIDSDETNDDGYDRTVPESQESMDIECSFRSKRCRRNRGTMTHKYPSKGMASQ